jgi:tetratricopeptide (TPR) repeat protein
MARVSRTSLVLGLVLLLPGALPAAPRPPATAPADWIARLDDPDPAVRQQAAQKLIALGPAARQPLIAAANSPQPALRSAAAAILLQLLWYAPGDPPPIRAILEHYGALPPADRRTVIHRLRALANDEKTRDGAWNALIRLLEEEPNQDVRWSLVAALRTDRRPDDLKRLRAWPGADQTSPALTLRGWAWLPIDQAQALALFQQALALEAAHPTQDGGTLDIAFDLLVRHHLARQEFDAAAAVRRQQAMRQPVGDEADEPLSRALFSLFALHARHGPLAGFHDDVARFAPALHRPALVYAMGQLYAHAGQPMVAQALYQAAYAAGAASPAARLEVAELLMSQGWYALAERELNAVLAAAGNARQAIGALAHLKLKTIAAACGNDFQAARHLQSVLEQRLTVVQTKTLTGQTTVVDNQALWAEVYWRYARAAQAEGDTAAMNKQLDSLLALHPNDPDLAQELVPLLKQLKRPQDAQTVFAAAYTAARAAVEARPDDPEPLNNLAWLCARCDERLEEARALAGRALALSPDNAAYLDTAAEVHFRLGRRAHAIRLEKQALRLRPDNSFMRRQLERFSRQVPANGAPERPATAPAE